MLLGIDSSFAKPNPTLAAQFRAAGVRIWSGYLVTKGNVGIAAPWTKADFDNAKLVGGMPLGYCSGWDDPVACKNLAAQWGVRLCLDVESGIRGDGPWVQAWLDASGAGLYGNAPSHNGRRAAFHILAAYPGYNPNATWSAQVPRPAGPCGWQWQGTHTQFGIAIDSTWFDDWFAQQQPSPAHPKEIEVILIADKQVGSPLKDQVYMTSVGSAAYITSPHDLTEIQKALQQPGYIAQLTDGTAGKILETAKHGGGMFIATIQNSPAQVLVTETALVDVIDANMSLALRSSGVPISSTPFTQAAIDAMRKALSAGSSAGSAAGNISGTITATIS